MLLVLEKLNRTDLEFFAFWSNNRHKTIADESSSLSPQEQERISQPMARIASSRNIIGQ